jgi:hypothetical protein
LRTRKSSAVAWALLLHRMRICGKCIASRLPCASDTQNAHFSQTREREREKEQRTERERAPEFGVEAVVSGAGEGIGGSGRGSGELFVFVKLDQKDRIRVETAHLLLREIFTIWRRNEADT